MRKKDAKDIAYLLTTYEAIPAISHQLYEDQNLMEIYDWDKTLAAAHRLGVDAKRITSVNTTTVICELLDNQSSTPRLEQLINEMGGGSTRQYTRNETLINAFKVGFEN